MNDITYPSITLLFGYNLYSYTIIKKQCPSFYVSFILIILSSIVLVFGFVTRRGRVEPKRCRIAAGRGFIQKALALLRRPRYKPNITLNKIKMRLSDRKMNVSGEIIARQRLVWVLSDLRGYRRRFLCLCLFLLFIQLLDGLDFFLQFHPAILKPDFDLAFR